MSRGAASGTFLRLQVKSRPLPLAPKAQHVIWEGGLVAAVGRGEQAALSVRAIDWERHWVRRSSNWFRISSAGWATCAALACAGGLPGGMWRVRLQTGALQEANSHVV
jgi:hypothetical protein